jgi:hypothetical protein
VDEIELPRVSAPHLMSSPRPRLSHILHVQVAVQIPRHNGVSYGIILGCNLFHLHAVVYTISLASQRNYDPYKPDG